MSIPLYIFKRFLNLIPLLIFVSIMSFFIVKLSPVDPLAELKLNPAISAETIKSEKERLGLNLPLHMQYFKWLSSFVKGDLGVSVSGEKVADRLRERIPNTLLLAFSTILVTWTIAIPLGIFSALNWRKTADKILTAFSSMGMAFPTFFLSLLLLIFAVKTGWFPVGGLTSPDFDKMNLGGKVFDIARHLFLPTFVLSAVSIASIQRQMRANLLDVLETDYVKMARAKGLPENKVIYKHALRNAINPMITLLGFEFASLLSGAAITEYVFQYPGLGRLILEGVIKLDINLVMASLMIGTIMLILGNLIADILLKINDPRISLD